MKVRTTKIISDGKYMVILATEEFSQNELAGMKKFGEPEVNIGGLYGEPDPVLPDPPPDPLPPVLPSTANYILPDNMEKIKTSFAAPGISMAFDSKDFADAEKRADVWEIKMISRISDAVLALRAKLDTFSEELVHNI